MERIFFFVFILSLLFVFNLSAQTPQEPPKEPHKINKRDKVTRELVQSLNKLYTGAAFVSAGSALTLIGTLYKKDENVSKILVFSGIGASIVGVVFVVESHSHIRNSGTILKLGISASGATVSLNF